MDHNQAHQAFITALRSVKGIHDAQILKGEDRQKLLGLEEKAEARSLMGLGKVVNSGVREVLACDLIYAVLTGMDFDWGTQATLVLKKGSNLVGEEVRDTEVIEKLKRQENVWFMHKNFVIYKDQVNFPQDIMEKVCYFEIPKLPATWCIIEDERFQCQSIVFASPSVLGDVYLKETYFESLDEEGSGTILVGAHP